MVTCRGLEKNKNKTKQWRKTNFVTWKSVDCFRKAQDVCALRRSHFIRTRWMCGPSRHESLPFCEESVGNFYKLSPLFFPLPPFFSFFKTVEAPEEKEEEKKVVGACYPHHYVDPISISFLLCATTNLTPAQQFSS